MIQTHVFILAIDDASWNVYRSTPNLSPIIKESEGFTLGDIIHNGPLGTIWRYTEQWTLTDVAGLATWLAAYKGSGAV